MTDEMARRFSFNAEGYVASLLNGLAMSERDVKLKTKRHKKPIVVWRVSFELEQH